MTILCLPVLVCLFVLLARSCDGFRLATKSSWQGVSRLRSQLRASVEGKRWQEIDLLREKSLISTVMSSTDQGSEPQLQDNLESMQKAAFKLKVGTAFETLRSQLPLLFYQSTMDYSIFADMITLADGNQNKLVVSKTFYKAGVSSLRMASSLSSIYPSLNLRRIEYLEDCRTIQCLVDVVLPDTVRLEGQSMWQGYWYFGLDKEGFVDTLVFDRKISAGRPQQAAPVHDYPWFQRQVAKWQPELLKARLLEDGSDNSGGNFYDTLLP